jgi:hypothetical protein
MKPLVSLVINDAHVHGAGVQINPAVKLVTLIVESHYVFS